MIVVAAEPRRRPAAAASPPPAASAANYRMVSPMQRWMLEPASAGRTATTRPCPCKRPAMLVVLSAPAADVSKHSMMTESGCVLMRLFAKDEGTKTPTPLTLYTYKAVTRRHSSKVRQCVAEARASSPLFAEMMLLLAAATAALHPLSPVRPRRSNPVLVRSGAPMKDSKTSCG